MSRRPYTIERSEGNVILDSDESGDRLMIMCAVPGHGEMVIAPNRLAFRCPQCGVEISKHEVWKNA